jgi:transketolase
MAILSPPSGIDTIELARRIRIDTVIMTSLGGGSHVGSCLSVADIMAVLYGSTLRVEPNQPKHPDRDRLILSKGHAGGIVYACLAEMGFFERSILATHYGDGSILSGHVSHWEVPGVEWSTGSLGQGLSLGCGVALSSRLRKRSSRTVVVMSDGECDEGQVWEAALFASHHKLEQLLAVVDYNHIQSLASTEETLNLEPFAEKWSAFGWEVRQVDGHDHNALRAAFEPSSGSQPVCVIADTVKGKGVPMMERSVLWHYRSPQFEELEIALSALLATAEDRALLLQRDAGYKAISTMRSNQHA